MNTTGWCSRIVFVGVALALVLAASGPVLAAGGPLLRGQPFLNVAGGASAALNAVSPANLVRQIATNYREHRFYGTNLQEYGSMRDALIKGSLMPANARQNISGAITSKVHPANLIGAITLPLSIELQRQIASGQGIDVGKLVKTLNPVVIGTTYLGGAVGDIAGAAIQSGLCSLGPVGAAAGFLLRPTIGFFTTIVGMAVGQNLVKGERFDTAIANALREIVPARDLGQMLGGTFGSVIGQVLIPIPVVGAFVGGMIGSIVGTVIASALDKVEPFHSAFQAMGNGLAWLAGRIDGKDRDRAEAPSNTGGDPVEPEPDPNAPATVDLLGVTTEGGSARAGGASPGSSAPGSEGQATASR